MDAPGTVLIPLGPLLTFYADQKLTLAMLGLGALLSIHLEVALYKSS